MIKTKFDYPDLSTEDQNGKRFYCVNDTKLPSVTTILGATKSQESTAALDNWRKRIGDTAAADILHNSITIGSALHKNIEDYFIKGPEHAAEGTLQVKLMTKLMFKEGLSNVDEVWGSEVALYYPDLYAGRSDMIGVYKGKPSIIDFKNSVREKRVEHISDYLQQCSAYKLAHDFLFNTDIEQYVILLVTQDFKFQEFVINKADQETYISKWLARLEDFHDTPPW